MSACDPSVRTVGRDPVRYDRVQSPALMAEALRLRVWLVLLGLCVVSGCATRPVNAPLAKADPTNGYRFETRPRTNDTDTLIVLAFSGGGTRAAAFSYGVLEELRRTELTINGRKTRMLDEVDMITGVSGGSFTALAYGLYGETLFETYEQAFLKRNVQGELIRRFLNPVNWGNLSSNNWGRSELAAQFYDEILFHGASFADLEKGTGPLILVTATDISSGSRLGFTQGAFDAICSDLDSVALSRAAAASSAVPFALSPVTLNNYGGSCGFQEPAWVRSVSDPTTRVRPAGRALQELKELRGFEDGAERPYIHLVDGGVSDNLGVRGILALFDRLDAGAPYKRSGRLDSVRRVAIFVVNSLSDPVTDWDKHERPPSDVAILVKATGVPIDRYSYEAVELLKDYAARWRTIRELRTAGAFANAGNLALAKAAARVPNIDVFSIDVSFDALQDPDERRYLKDQPTSFMLPPEAVDRLRAAAGVAIRESVEFQRLVRDMSQARPPESVVPPIQVR
jgi:NTE family protein